MRRCQQLHCNPEAECLHGFHIKLTAEGSLQLGVRKAFQKLVTLIDAFPERRKSCVCGGTFLHEGIDCIEQNPVIGIPDSQNLLCFLFAGVIK